MAALPGTSLDWFEFIYKMFFVLKTTKYDQYELDDENFGHFTTAYGVEDISTTVIFNANM